MRAEIVTVGSELLLGQIVDSNSAFIARQLAAIGLDLHFKTTVGDNLGRLTEVLKQALSRSEVVITTGGIGPTADDVTREAVAEATGCPLEFSASLMAEIEAFFRARGMSPSPSNQKQAHLPRGALAISNPVGTAPGFILPIATRVIVTLPGVPREMEHLLTTQVVPYLKERYRLSGVIRSRILKVCGLGESRIGETLRDFMETGANPTVGTMAHLGQVDIRIAAKADTVEKAMELIAPVEADVRRRLGDLVFGADEETLEGVVVQRLLARRWWLGSIEVGAAGLLGSRLHGHAGAEGVYRGGLAASGTAGALPPPLDGLGPRPKGADLASAVSRWLGTEVGVAVVVTEDPAGPEAGRVVGRISVVTPERTDEKEYTFGGAREQVLARLGTLSLDAVRRVL